MHTKPRVITWSCTPQENYYLLAGRLGDLELFEIIERQKWVRAIDRVLLFKRAIGSMSAALHSVISAGIE